MSEHHPERPGASRAVSRRTILKGGMWVAAGLGSLTSTRKVFSADKTPIKIGVLEDKSGDFALTGIPKHHAVEIALKEINASGGLLGREVTAVSPDPQSDTKRYQELSRRLIQQDKVDVLFGGFTSASREAVRPVIDRFKFLYFYNNQYEGGVCDTYNVCTGAVPEQQFSTLVPYMIEKYGPKIYTIAADYNFGQISAKWVRVIAEKSKGKLIGEEFIPLSVSQFGSTIQKIQAAKPDVLMTLLVGVNQASFYEQQAAAGLNLPMGSSVNCAQAYEHKRFKPPALKGMHVTTNFMEEIQEPRVQAFVKKWRTYFPDEPYVAQEAQTEYMALQLYFAAVKKAGSVDQTKVRQALWADGGLRIEAPEGAVKLDPRSNHVSHNIWLAVIDEKHNATFPKRWDDIKPYWLGDEKGCNLPVKPDKTQYQPI